MGAINKDEIMLHTSSSRKVVRISEDRAMKSGENFNLYEAEALKFVASNTTIPVPKVHDEVWSRLKTNLVCVNVVWALLCCFPPHLSACHVSSFLFFKFLFNTFLNYPIPPLLLLFIHMCVAGVSSDSS